MSARPTHTATRWALGALLLAVALLGGLTLHELREAPEVLSSVPTTASPRGAAAVTPEERPPWMPGRPRGTALPAGTVPVSLVDPPPPEPSTPMPPPPVEPPNPAEHRPPLHNPGGVNGDRPPRSP